MCDVINDCEECKFKRGFEFQSEILYILVKRKILEHISNADDDKVKDALQELFLDIYVYPKDIFERKSVDELICECQKSV